MANLPQRPVECDQRYSPEDRHYPPTVSRMAPMRYDRRDDRDRDPRSRPEGDVYVPSPSRGYASSYVSSYDRHEGDRYKSYRHDPDYRREEDSRQWYNRDRRDSEPRSWEREHYGRVDSRRWERDTWVASDYDRDRQQLHERDRGRDYARDRDRDRDQGISRGEGNERPLSPRRDLPRPRRDSRSPLRSPLRKNTRSPPRRTGPHTYADHSPDRRRRSMSPRRSSHHQSSSYTHDQPNTTARSNSRAPTPPSKRTKASNSIANSPRSPVRNHEHVSPRDPTRHHSPPRRASRSQSPVRNIKDEHQLDIASRKRSPSPPTKERPTGSPTLKQNTQTSRSLSPVEPKSNAGVQLPSPQDKGKLKEQVPTDYDDTDIKMRDSSPSPPRHPRGAPPSGPSGRTSRSPPRGPRNHPKTPTAPASFYHPNASASWSRRNNSMLTTSPMSATMDADQNPINESELPPTAPVAMTTLPMIPVYPTKLSITCELDKEIARIQTHRAHLISDYVQVAKATRRALHELDIATIDLRAAENRRKLADSQVERARAGLLGINAMQVS